MYSLKKIFPICLLVLVGCNNNLVTSNNRESTSNSFVSAYNSGNEKSNVLVSYFSCTGNTKNIANDITKETEGILFEIKPTNPYKDEDLNYSNSSSRATMEQNDDGVRPEILESVSNWNEYDSVFIGYPLWFGIAPRIIQTYLESYDFTNKYVYIFSTSASSSGTNAFNRLKSTYTNINFVSNIHFTSSNLSSSESLISNWIKHLDLKK